MYHQPYAMQGPTYAQCNRCGYVGTPTVVEQISVAGWIVFTVLLFLCLPLFWIGLLIKDRKVLCPNCGTVH